MVSIRGGSSPPPASIQDGACTRQSCPWAQRKSLGALAQKLTPSQSCAWIVDVPRQLPLPVDALIPDIAASLQHTPNLVIEAEPGAGKTTRIPPALLGAFRGQVLVLEPRRIAARLAARRV